MSEKKMTRAQALTAAIAYAEQDGNAECVDVLKKMLTSITKPRKATTSKTRIQNENLARKVYDAVEGAVTSKDVAALGIAGIPSSQKATAVMNVAVDLGLFSKAKDGKCLVYTKVDGDSEE
jgi:formaldehyde-activating enzyme involved in methanogenesis